VNPRGGYKPDPEIVRQRRPKFHMLKAARGLGIAALPLSTNNRRFLPASAGGPGVRNQQQVGACEGFGHSSGITIGAAIAGKPIPIRSWKGPYTLARVLAEVADASGEFPPLTDSGTEPSLILQAGQTWGWPAATDWPDGTPDPSTINDPPNLAGLEAAEPFKLSGAYFLTSQGEQFCRDLMTALASGYVATNAIAASSSTFNDYSSGVLGPLDDDVDHCTLYLDFSWDGTNISSVVFDALNSWTDENSPPWGWSDIPGIPSGLYQCNAAFAQKYCQDCAVLDVKGAT
jgi:hypothetical protein